MRSDKKNCFPRALLIVLIDVAAMLLLGGLTALSKYAGGAVHFIILWILTPLIGALCAYLSTLKGLNNYLAWIFPPLMLFIAWYLFWHYAPSPGPVFVCALISLIGAATGDVVKKRRKK